MDSELVPGLDGLSIRIPTSDDYRTCAVCGGDCDPDTSLIANDTGGVPIAFVCPEHGAQSIVDPFEGVR